MTFKLIKYEWKAMIRAMLPIYAATLALAVVNGLAINNEFFARAEGMLEGTFLESIIAIFQVLLIVIYICLLAGLFIMTFIATVQRFYKGLLRDEGYLMFTLPVSVSQLTFSRAFVAVIIMFLSGVVGFFAIGLLAGMDFLRGLIMLPGEIASAISRAVASGEISPGLAVHAGLYVIELIVMFLLGSFEGVYGFYAAMALGQLSRNHKVAMSVVWYIILGIVETTLVWSLIFIMTGPAVIVFSGSILDNAVISLHVFLILMNIITILLLAARVLITNVVLSRRLNLE